jgi:hypothetical protein
MSNSRQILSDYAVEQGWEITASTKRRLTIKIRPLPGAPLGGPQYVMDLFFRVNGDLDSVFAAVGYDWGRDRIQGGRAKVVNVIMRLGAGMNYEDVVRP